MTTSMNLTAASIRTWRGSGSTPTSAGSGNGSTLSQYGSVRMWRGRQQVVQMSGAASR